MIIPHLPSKDLHLSAQPPKRRRVNDSVAIALVRPAIILSRLGVLPTRRVERVLREGRKNRLLPFGNRRQRKFRLGSG